MTERPAPLWLPPVDYRNTSRRPAWDRLPTAVRAAVAQVAGSRVVSADPPVGSGFSGAFAGRVGLADGRHVFVKAGSPDQPFAVAALAQEATVLERLPAGMPVPALVGFDTVEGWNLLVLAVVPGSMPGAPWTPQEVDAVHRACLTVAELGTPSEVGDGDLAHRMSADPEILSVGRALAEGRFPADPRLPSWLPSRAGDVGDLVLGAEGRFDGETICHGDLRPDNLLVTPGPGGSGGSGGPASAVVVDWNWVGPAAAWVDFVGLLPLMAAQGVDTDALVAASPLTRDVDPQDIDAFLATIAAYMLNGYEDPPPPGCTPVLRQHQVLMAHAFLGLLRHRRRWA